MMCMTREELFEQNQKLVPYIMSNELHIDQKEFDYEDLMQEGYIILWEATGKYDESRGKSFSTFACNCIINRLLKRLSKPERKRHKRFYYDESVALDRMIDDNTPVYALTADTSRDYDKELWSTLCELRNDTIPSILLWEHLYEGYTCAELAKKHNLKYGTVANYINQEKKRLHKAVKM